MAKQFDYQGAKKAGYSDEEITQHLSQIHPKFDFKAAQAAGYSPEEINQHLSSYSPKKTAVEKTGRLAGQLALGAAENVLLPYEFGVAPLASKEAQQVPYRENLFADIERLQEQKAMGQWDSQDQELYDQLVYEAQNPRESEKFIKTTDLGVRGLAEEMTGQDLHPEGALEKAAHWTGFIKKPWTAKELIKMGTSPKEIAKAIMPGKDALRGLGAGSALQLAEEGNFGPLGTMASAIVGDLMGGGVAGIGKAIAQPKKTLAATAALLASSKGAIKNDLAQAAKETNYTKDIGTLTGNNMVQMIQARLTASGLTGKPLENLRKQMTKEIVEEYKLIADEVGHSVYESQHEAGEAGKEYLKRAREADEAIHSNLYKKFKESLPKDAKIKPTNSFRSVSKMMAEMSPGSAKTAEEQAVLDKLSKLLDDMSTQSVPIEVMLNNKRSLQNFVDYEMVGGDKNRLKHIISEIDKDLINYGSENPKSIKLLVEANKKFKDHADTFRNKNLNALFKSQDPTSVMNKMNSVQGIRDLKKALYRTPEGQETFKNLARMKLDNVIGKNMVDGVTEQLKAGKFVNVLEKGKNREIVRELLSPEAYKRLLNLQKHVGKLAESAQKFFNASQSATAGADLATVGTILVGIVGMVSGNPFALNTSLGVIGGSKMLSNLIADPKFLKMVEEAIEASDKKNISSMSKVASKMVGYVEQSAPGALHEIDRQKSN